MLSKIHVNDHAIMQTKKLFIFSCGLPIKNIILGYIRL